MFDSKGYKQEQKEYFEMLRTQFGGHFDKYITSYIQWKVDSLYKAYRSINPKMDDSEAKALATRIDGAITSMEEILRRMR